jgi:preprotein translocase subunit SecE
METPSSQQSSPASGAASSSFKDTALLWLAVALAGTGLWSFYYFDPQLSALIRTLILLGSLVAAAFVGWASAPGKELAGYVTGAYRIELRKVVWPTRQESLQATLMIAVFVTIFALLLAGVDWLLGLGVRSLIGRGA